MYKINILHQNILAGQIIPRRHTGPSPQKVADEGKCLYSKISPRLVKYYSRPGSGLPGATVALLAWYKLDHVIPQ